MSVATPLRLSPLRALSFGSPVAMIFVSSNVANAGNLAYNMLFSRWLGPELFGDLAVILTIKLSLLAILNAVQMAVSRDVAGGADAGRLADYGRVSGIALLGGIALLPPAAFFIWAFDIGSVLRLSQPVNLLILCCALPFATPLCLARGVVTGRLSVAAIVGSTQVEMGVRLFGGMAAWHAGLGLEGVTLAIALSILAGWAVIARELPATNRQALPRGMLRGLAVAAMPFAVLQLTQVALLDGDILIAKLALSSEEAGFAAALALFQRIEFFACFALASVMLPAVTAACANGESPWRAARPVAALFLLVSVPFLALSALAPAPLMGLLAGSGFAPAAPLLWQVAGSATAFTFSYLVATWLLALGDRSGVRLFALWVPVQFIAIFAASTLFGGLTLPMLAACKLLSQIGLALCLLPALLRSGAAGARPLADHP